MTCARLERHLLKLARQRPIGVAACPGHSIQLLVSCLGTSEPLKNTIKY